MIDATVLAYAACIELGLLAGYSLCAVRAWVADGRNMVCSFCTALTGNAEAQ